MIRAGVKEVRQNLTEYLRRVQRGEEIVVTKRDEPIARLVPFLRKKTKRLESHKSLRQHIAAKGAPLSEIVSSQREERF